ncbi:hypothetical protein Ae201684P_000308 [Aphanomyces euteiches]|nr:hypothetical protein Ae201684P_000308 [Aphanomyces euteiches]
MTSSVSRRRLPLFNNDMLADESDDEDEHGQSKECLLSKALAVVGICAVYVFITVVLTEFRVWEDASRAFLRQEDRYPYRFECNDPALVRRSHAELSNLLNRGPSSEQSLWVQHKATMALVIRLAHPSVVVRQDAVREQTDCLVQSMDISVSPLQRESFTLFAHKFSTWYHNAHDMNSSNIFQAPHEWKQCVSLSLAFKWRLPHAILDLRRMLHLDPISAGDLGSRTTIPVETSCNLSGFDPIELWTFMASLLPAPVATVCNANDPRLWHPRQSGQMRTGMGQREHIANPTLKHDNLNVYLPLTLPTDAGNAFIPSGIVLQSQRNITTLSSFVCTAHWQLIALLHATSQTYANTTELWSRILDRYCHGGSTSSLEFPNHRHEFIQAHCQSGDLLLRVLSNAWNMSET